MSNQLQVSGEAKIRAIQGPVVANSGVITALDGDASEYVRGDGTLADFPTSTGGGSSVSYYLNTSVSQGTIGGVAYKQLSKTPISGAGTDVTISANGYIASYITDANDPALLEVPAGNFNCEFYFSVNSNSHNPYVYAELYKYDGTTFTLLGSNVAIPQYLTNGTTLSAYYFAIPVATSVLTVTDRIAIRIYVNVDGRTVTLHTENNHLCQVVTTFSKGLISLNNLTRQNQFFATGTSGTDFAISSSVATHTFNLPVASASNTGKLSSTDWSTFNGKVPYTGATANVDLGNFNFDANEIRGASIIAKLNGLASSPFILMTGSSGYIFGYDAISMISSPTTANTLIITSNIGVITKTAQIGLGSLTATRTFTLPDASGTIALTSNLSSYVPYTGATASVNIGNNLLSSASIQLNGDNTSNFGYLGFKQYAGGSSGFNGYTSIFAQGTNSINIAFSATGGSKTISFLSDLISSSTTRSYSLPDADGTIALTSSLSSYLPLAGGTLTGALNGTSAVFSSTVQASAYRLTGMTGGSGALYWTSDRVTLANYNATGVVNIEANGGTSVATFGGATYNNDFVGTLRNTTSAYFATTSGNVGIGNSSPSYTLDVSGTGRFTGNLISSTNILIGTTTVGDKLTIVNSGSFAAMQIGNGTNSSFFGYANGSGNYNNGASSGDAIIRGFSGVSISGTNGASTNLYINSTGNVGIGTSSPTSILHAYRNNGTDINFTIENGSTAGFSSSIKLVSAVDFGAGYHTISSNTSGGSVHWSIGSAATTNTMAFYTNNNVERMRITSGGNVGIGNTGSASVRLQVSGVDSTSSNIALALKDSATNDLFYVRNDGIINTGTRAGSPYNNTSGSAANMVVTSSGFLERAVPSSLRFKENIKEWNESGLNTILGLKPKTFKYKKEYFDKADVDFLGLIAEEVAQVCPYLADYENEDRTGQVENVRYAFIVVPLIKAIQEQQIQIQNLQEQINILAK